MTDNWFEADTRTHFVILHICVDRSRRSLFLILRKWLLQQGRGHICVSYGSRSQESELQRSSRRIAPPFYRHLIENQRAFWKVSLIFYRKFQKIGSELFPMTVQQNLGNRFVSVWPSRFFERLTLVTVNDLKTSKVFQLVLFVKWFSTL